ncbi:hypothetical protein GQ53DRAFT_808030 [Thozetella sp. PMI_491]|nr:hypothetical protein GQ53DRAFT_808030 [Thozetella sp. PMI_491]
MATDTGVSSRNRPTLSLRQEGSVMLAVRSSGNPVPGDQSIQQDRSPEENSAVRYLEERLAEVEAQRAVGQNDHLREHRSDPSWSEHAAHRDGNSRAAVLEIASLAMGSVCTSSLLQPDLGIYYEGKLFYTSERPPLKIPVRGIYNEEPPRKASKGSEFRLPDMGALKIPFKVATALFNNYISNVLPRYPCFLESDLLEHFNQFYKDGNPESVSSDITWFIISMVLAISSLTSKAHDFRKVSSLGESLQRDALRRSSFLGSSNMRSLQCFLLLIQMALLLPYAANLWYMSGEAMRMAIALGLHQEVDGNPEIDSVEVNLRRSVFWTMQSEIHGVQFFDQELPTDTTDYNEWVKKMEKSIQIWQDNSGSDAVLPEWSVNAANHSRLLLYRPCSRNIIPPDSSLQAASTIAIRMIHDYWNLAQGGSLAFSFQSVYNVFHAAMILLYALRNHGQILRDCHLEEEARQGLHLLPQVFAVLSVRWPVAMDTGRYVEDLKETILRTLDLGDDSEQSGYDMDFLGELDFMITQRRIHSVYHRNVEIHAPAERVASDRSPWSQVDPFTPVPDELWQEFITANAIEPEPTGLPADNIGDAGPFLAQEPADIVDLNTYDAIGSFLPVEPVLSQLEIASTMMQYYSKMFPGAIYTTCMRGSRLPNSILLTTLGSSFGPETAPSAAIASTSYFLIRLVRQFPVLLTP